MEIFLFLASPIDGVGAGGTAGIDAGLRVFRLSAPRASKSGGNSAPVSGRKKPLFPAVRKLLLPILVVSIIVLLLVLHLCQFKAKTNLKVDGEENWVSPKTVQSNNNGK